MAKPLPEQSIRVIGMFLTANELVGIPGLPGTVQGIRNRLNKLSGDHPELIRKRTGTKAFEYHIDCLPEAAQDGETTSF